MAKYCVAWINFFDNDLKQVIVEATEPKTALFAATSEFYTEDQFDDILDSDIEVWKQRAFDMDSMFEVTEL